MASSSSSSHRKIISLSSWPERGVVPPLPGPARRGAGSCSRSLWGRWRSWACRSAGFRASSAARPAGPPAFQSRDWRPCCAMRYSLTRQFPRAGLSSRTSRKPQGLVGSGKAAHRLSAWRSQSYCPPQSPASLLGGRTAHNIHAGKNAPKHNDGAGIQFALLRSNSSRIRSENQALSLPFTTVLSCSAAASARPAFCC